MTLEEKILTSQYNQKVINSEKVLIDILFYKHYGRLDYFNSLSKFEQRKDKSLILEQRLLNGNRH